MPNAIQSELVTAPCDETSGFPSHLRPHARAVLASVIRSEMQSPRGSFEVKVDYETLHIPYRVYADSDRLRRVLDDAEGDDKLIVACLGTRHHDGFVRQQSLTYLVGSEVAWVMPYIVQLASEYVVEIVDIVADRIARFDEVLLAAFAQENAAYLATTRRRVTSYWSCYHRLAYPDRNDYPGSKVMVRLQQALAEASAHESIRRAKMPPGSE